jgi:hypothetical protein
VPPPTGLGLAGEGEDCQRNRASSQLAKEITGHAQNSPWKRNDVDGINSGWNSNSQRIGKLSLQFKQFGKNFTAAYYALKRQSIAIGVILLAI